MGSEQRVDVTIYITQEEYDKLSKFAAKRHKTIEATIRAWIAVTNLDGDKWLHPMKVEEKR